MKYIFWTSEISRQMCNFDKSGETFEYLCQCGSNTLCKKIQWSTTVMVTSTKNNFCLCFKLVWHFWYDICLLLEFHAFSPFDTKSLFCVFQKLTTDGFLHKVCISALETQLQKHDTLEFFNKAEWLRQANRNFSTATHSA